MCRIGIGLQEVCRGITGREVKCGDPGYLSPIAVDVYDKKTNEMNLCDDRRRKELWRYIERLNEETAWIAMDYFEKN